MDLTGPCVAASVTFDVQVSGSGRADPADWNENCTCPGSPADKEIVREIEVEGEQRKELTAAAMEEVKAANPQGREQVLAAFEAAYERRGLEFGNIERQFLPDALEASRAPRISREVQGLKLLGKLGTTVFKDVRKLLAHDEQVEPETTALNELVELARSLGDAGRYDQEAVEQLRRLAGGNIDRVLERASDWFAAEDGSLMDEYDNWDLSYRLLQAAAGNGALAPVTPTRAELHNEVHLLEETSPEAGWDRLIEKQPALREFEDEISSGDLARGGTETFLERLHFTLGPWRPVRPINC